jgi:hypothetical protein
VGEGVRDVEPEEPVDGDTEPDVDEDWPVLSELELDICVSESSVPGVETTTRDLEKP